MSYTHWVWDVEFTDEFEVWWESLDEADQDAVAVRVVVLQQDGPNLGRPVVDRVHQSRHPHMKELRCEQGVRVLFAFDPRRTAILLIGGDKSPADTTSPAWNAWYDQYVPIADQLYDQHLASLTHQGLL